MLLYTFKCLFIVINIILSLYIIVYYCLLLSIIAICRNPNTWKVPWCDTPSSDFFSAAQPICNSLHCTTAAQLQLALSSVRNGTGFPWTGLQVRTKTNSGQMVRPFQGKRQDYVGFQKIRAMLKSNQTAISSRNFTWCQTSEQYLVHHGPCPQQWEIVLFLAPLRTIKVCCMQILAVSNLEGIHRTTHGNAQGSPALSGYEFAFHPSFPWKASYVRRRLHWDFGCRTSGGFSGKKCSIFKCLNNLRCLAKLVKSICMP